MLKRQYILSERSHLMLPNMHFGIKATIKAEYNLERIKQSLNQLEENHSFLKSIVSKEESSGKYYYSYQEDIHIQLICKENPNYWQNYYKECARNGWNVEKEPLLKVIVMPKEESFVCLFVAHHLLGDGRAILGILGEFADAYVTGKKRKMVKEHLIESINDLPEGSDLPFISRVVVDSANKNWAKEKQTVSYGEYLDFEREFLHRNPVTYTEETVTKEEVDKLRKLCKEHGVSVNDYLVAKMMVEERTNKVIIAADIRKDLCCYNENALGNYATAFGVVVKNIGTDVWKTAASVSKRIKKIKSNPRNTMLVLACYFRMNPELIDAVAISTLGEYKSKAGLFVGSNMFGYKKRNGYSVTNLGNINNENMEDGMCIPPASPANKKTMGVLSVNGKMNKCTVIYQ